MSYDSYDSLPFVMYTRVVVLCCLDRLVIDDGSGEAHVYAEDDLLRQLLQVSMAEWNSVCDLVRRVGTVSYTKSFSATQHVCLYFRMNGLLVPLTVAPIIKTRTPWAPVMT